MKSFRDFDWLLLAFVLIICSLGVLEIYSSTYGTKFAATTGTPLYVKQIYWILGGMVLMFVVSKISHQFLLENAHWFYIASLSRCWRWRCLERNIWARGAGFNYPEACTSSLQNG